MARWQLWLIDQVLDDQIGVASLSKSVSDHFTDRSHYKKLTVIYLVKNVYNQGKSQTIISLNSNFSIVFRNGRDTSQIRTKAYQIWPTDRHWLVDACTDAKSKPYMYRVLNHNPSTPDN